MAQDFVDGEDVVSVDCRAGNSVPRSAVDDRGVDDSRDMLLDGVLIVLDHEDDGQLPNRGKIKALVEVAAIGRAVAQ